MEHGSLSSASIPAKRRPHIIHRSLRLTPLRLRLFITLLNLKLPVSLTAAEACLHVTEIHLSGSLHTDTRGARLAAMCSVSVPGSSSAHTINISKSVARWHKHANTHSCHLVLLVSSLPHTHTLVSRSQKKQNAQHGFFSGETRPANVGGRKMFQHPFYVFGCFPWPHTHTHVVATLVYTAHRVCTNHAGHVVSPPPPPIPPPLPPSGWVDVERASVRVRACLLVDGGGCGIEEALSAALREVALAGDRASRLEARLPLKKTSDIHLQLWLGLPKPRTPGRRGENT